MKITKEKLVKLIKEELATMSDEEFEQMHWSKGIDPELRALRLSLKEYVVYHPNLAYIYGDENERTASTEERELHIEKRKETITAVMDGIRRSIHDALGPLIP